MNAESRRETILAVTLEMIGERGVAGLSTRTLSRRAGVSEALIFHHFGTKAGLVGAAARSGDTLLSRLIAVTEGPPSDDLGELVDAFVDEAAIRMAPGAPGRAFGLTMMSDDPNMADVRAEGLTLLTQTRAALGDWMDRAPRPPRHGGHEAAATLLEGVLWRLATLPNDAEGWAAAAPAAFDDLRAYMKSRGALDVGFLPDVDPRLIFAGEAIPERHAIVFTVEMQREDMATAPSSTAFAEVLEGYGDLGRIAADTCDWLRERGIAAYPGTNIGGQTDYPAMAEAAGLGAMGYHGLLIGPGAGARVRVSSIYVGIDDLPAPQNPHLWVRDICANCRKCVRSCPPGAIEPAPVPKANGGRRSIRATACRDYFARNWGCGVCLKVCPFSDKGYEAVKAAYDAAQGAEPAPISTIEVPEAEAEGPRVAVVGAGAAGFYLAKSILEDDPTARIDLYERLPFPHGLVRYGVAPDHPEVRNKGFTFDRMLEHPRVRLMAGVEIGRNVTAEDLRGAYDAVCLAHGAPSNRRLGVEGEDLPGSYAAPDLVRWYNAHPDFADLDPRIGREIAIIGHGNVALDTARMLLTDPQVLVRTDMMPEAAARIAAAQVDEVQIIGRTGPSQTSFTPKEIVELSELPGVQIVIDAGELAADLALPHPDPQAERRRKRNLELFAEWAAAPRDPARRAVRIRFFRNPAAILGEARVEGLRLEVTRMVERDGRARHEATGETEQIATGAVIRAIGFLNVAVPGLPFDEARARVPVGPQGRVLDGPGGDPLPFVYAAGWARRGPVGVIGTNKTDAEEVAEALRADLAEEPGRRGAPGLDPEGVIHLDDWADIAREEKRRGAIRGHGPLRFVNPSEARAWLDSHGRRRLNDPTLAPDAPEVGRPDPRYVQA